MVRFARNLDARLALGVALLALAVGLGVYQRVQDKSAEAQVRSFTLTRYSCARLWPETPLGRVGCAMTRSRGGRAGPEFVPARGAR